MMYRSSMAMIMVSGDTVEPGDGLLWWNCGCECLHFPMKMTVSAT